MGLIIGFLVYGVFIIFAVVSLCADAYKTDAKIATGIKESIQTLKTKFKLDDKQIENLLAEFEEKDAKLQSGFDENDD